jgi:hypothetical protein
MRFVIAVILHFSLDNQSGLALSFIKPAVKSAASCGFMICPNRLFAQKNPDRTRAASFNRKKIGLYELYRYKRKKQTPAISGGCSIIDLQWNRLFYAATVFWLFFFFRFSLSFGLLSPIVASSFLVVGTEWNDDQVIPKNIMK